MISGKAAENEPGWIKKHISTETIYTEIAAPLHCRVEQNIVVVGEGEAWSGNA